MIASTYAKINENFAIYLYLKLKFNSFKMYMFRVQKSKSKLERQNVNISEQVESVCATVQTTIQKFRTKKFKLTVLNIT